MTETRVCPLCGGPHLSASVHSSEELRAWEATQPSVHINDGSAEARAMEWSKGYSEGFEAGVDWTALGGHDDTPG